MTEHDTRIAAIGLERPLRVPDSSTLRAVAGAMEDARVSCALVGSGPPKLVTEHDLAGALAAGLSPEAPVSQIATKEPIWATSSTTVPEAVAMMVGHGIRHLLVLAPGGEVEGILSLSVATTFLLDAAAPLEVPTQH